MHDMAHDVALLLVSKGKGALHEQFIMLCSAQWVGMEIASQ
jgi:hypothetical protein